MVRIEFYDNEGDRNEIIEAPHLTRELVSLFIKQLAYYPYNEHFIIKYFEKEHVHVGLTHYTLDKNTRIIAQAWKNFTGSQITCQAHVLEGPYWTKYYDVINGQARRRYWEEVPDEIHDYLRDAIRGGLCHA